MAVLEQLPKPLASAQLKSLKPGSTGRTLYVDSKFRMRYVRIGLLVSGHSKTWYIQYTFGGRTRRKRIGNWLPDDQGMSLKQAHEEGLRVAGLILAGENPFPDHAHAHASRRSAGEPTFGECLDEFVAWLARPVKVGSTEPVYRTWRQYRSRLLLPEVQQALRDMPVPRITEGLLEAMMDEIRENRGPHQAKLVHWYLKTFFRWARAEKRLLKDDPTKELRGPGGTTTTDRALSWGEILRTWQTLEVADGMPYRCIQLILLTGVRLNEAMRAPRAELEPDGWWTIPSSRFSDEGEFLGGMKGKRDQRIWVGSPLAAPVVKRILEEGRESRWLFPSVQRRGAPIATVDRAILRLRETTEIGDLTAKVLRATMGSRMAELNIPREDRSRCLHHTEQGVTEKHYTVYDFDAQKRAAWDRYHRALTWLFTGVPDPELLAVRDGLDKILTEARRRAAAIE